MLVNMPLPIKAAYMFRQLQNPKSYEHIEPEIVGNSRHIMISNQSGRSNIISRLNEIGLHLKRRCEK